MADQKKVKQQAAAKQNVIESLKGLGQGVSRDFFSELVGFPMPQRKVSGEISAGESLQMSEALSGKIEENKKLKAQIALERNLATEEARLSQEKIGKLRVQLQALMQEIAALAQPIQALRQEAIVATYQVPANPGVYHIIFFEKILEFIQSFRKKIEDAATWLNVSNKRAEKKNYWAMYKRKGASFLLAPDHYLQRSAG